MNKKMLKEAIKKGNGFTIIEVALVLAIAGLIFLVVFLALPALQNSQKDTATREAVGKVVSGLESYYSDNQGTNASTAANITTVGGYVGTLSNGLTISLASTSTAGAVPGGASKTNIAISAPGFTCGSAGQLATGNSSNQAAVVQLQSGSYYCANM